MTLKEITNSKKDTLTAADIAPVIGCDQQSIRLQARECPEKLGFPVICTGTRVRIPREAFIRFMRGVVTR